MKEAASLAIALLALGCRQDMHDQPRYEPLEPSAFFAEGQSARPPVQGTVARGTLRQDLYFFTGKVGNTHGNEIPFSPTREVLLRGQERYNIYCAPCHSRTGDGDGMIVRRGYRRPPSFHEERMRQAPLGHYFDAITNGFGAMPDYAPQVAPRDRWAIAAYIRALQLSQRAAVEDVPPAIRPDLEKIPAQPPGNGVAPEAQR